MREVKRRLRVMQRTPEGLETTEESVYDSADMYRWLDKNNTSVVRVEMVWDSVLGDQRVVFKDGPIEQPGTPTLDLNPRRSIKLSEISDKDLPF